MLSKEEKSFFIYWSFSGLAILELCLMLRSVCAKFELLIDGIVSWRKDKEKLGKVFYVELGSIFGF